MTTPLTVILWLHLKIKSSDTNQNRNFITSRRVLTNDRDKSVYFIYSHSTRKRNYIKCRTDFRFAPSEWDGVTQLRRPSFAGCKPWISLEMHTKAVTIHNLFIIILAWDGDTKLEKMCIGGNYMYTLSLYRLLILKYNTYVALQQHMIIFTSFSPE